MFTVKRAFKSNGICYEVGSIILDPTLIKLFKTKVKEGRIIEVTMLNYKSLAEYLYSRTGVNQILRFKEALGVPVERAVVKLKG